MLARTSRQSSFSLLSAGIDGVRLNNTKGTYKAKDPKATMVRLSTAMVCMPERRATGDSVKDKEYAFFPEGRSMHGGQSKV